MTKDLIIVRASSLTLHNSWIDPGKPRSWDLFVCPFQQLPPQVESPEGVLLCAPIAGLKFAALSVLLKNWDGWRDYRYVMLADDDLYAPQDTWSRFFEACVANNAKLAAPALTEDSFFSHLITVRNREFVSRRVTFVESMMPTFRVDVLADLQPVLDAGETGSGWGIDFLWSKQLNYQDLFIVDATAVAHTRPVGRSRNPELHDKVSAELKQILTEHRLNWSMKTLSGCSLDGREVADASLNYKLARGYRRIFEQRPELFEQFCKLQMA